VFLLIDCDLSYHYPKPVSKRFFRFFCELIFDECIEELKKLMLVGIIEMDEALFGGRRRGEKCGWGAEGKHIVFGIYPNISEME